VCSASSNTRSLPTIGADTLAYANADPLGAADAQSDAYSDADAHSDADANSLTDGNAGGNVQPPYGHTVSNGVTNTDAHGRRSGDVYAECDAEPHADGHSNADASADSAGHRYARADGNRELGAGNGGAHHPPDPNGDPDRSGFDRHANAEALTHAHCCWTKQIAFADGGCGVDRAFTDR